jgi:hypothetical protein
VGRQSLKSIKILKKENKILYKYTSGIWRQGVAISLLHILGTMHGNSYKKERKRKKSAVVE